MTTVAAERSTSTPGSNKPPHQRPQRSTCQPGGRDTTRPRPTPTGCPLNPITPTTNRSDHPAGGPIPTTHPDRLATRLIESDHRRLTELITRPTGRPTIHSDRLAD
jgi:hypothetical protein